MFPWVCTVIDHRRYPNAMTTSVTPLAALCATFCAGFDIICNLLLNRCTETWNLFVEVNLYCLPINSWAVAKGQNYFKKCGLI